MKLGPAILGLLVGSCAPPGYRYEAGSFAPRPIETPYPVPPQRIAEDVPSPKACDEAARQSLIDKLRELRREEDRLQDRALRDDRAYSELMALGTRDRALQDRIIAVCPNEELPNIK